MSTRTASLRRLGRIFARARTPIFLLDSDRRLIYGNPAFETLTGRSVESLVGSLLDEPGRDGEPAAALATLAPPAEARRGCIVSSPGLIVHPDGEPRQVRVEFRPLSSSTERLVGVLGLIHPEGEPPAAPESDSHRLRVEYERIRAVTRNRVGGVELIGSGPAHERLLAQIRTAGGTVAPAWIVAEPGCGTRSVAAAIHAIGATPTAPLLVFDVAALPPDALERALFATAGRSPRPPIPPGSTVLLTHASSLGRDLQSLLVEELPRFAADGVRILAHSLANPQLDRDADLLRDDFFYALTSLVLTLRPLRERLAELPLLAQHFLERANRASGRRRLGFTPAAIDALRAHDWPGNLTELERVVAWAHARAASDLIDTRDWPASIRGEWACSFPPPAPAPPEVGLDAALETVERRLIERALQLTRFNKSRAADRLGISRPRLYRRMQELGIADLTETSDTRG